MKVIDQGKTIACGFGKSSKLAAKADFSQGKVVNVTSKIAAWDTVVAGPYNAKWKSIADASFRADTVMLNRVILRCALRLNS